MRLTSFALLAALAAPASLSAQTSLVVDLPLGQVKITQGAALGDGAKASAGGQSIDIDSAYLPQVLAKHDNAVLLQTYSGGNACPADHLWLVLTPQGITLSEVFGTCAEAPQIERTDSYPRVVMEGNGEDLARHQYDFDGTRITETKIAPRGQGEPAPLPASWEGASAYALISDARMMPALQAILTTDQIAQLRKSLELQLDGDAFRREGDWLIGGGCEPASVGTNCGQIAVSLVDGALLAGHEQEGVITSYGANAAAMFGVYALDPSQITGNWAISAVNGTAVHEMITVEIPDLQIDFAAEGALSGQGFCNRFMGMSVIEKRKIVVSDLSTTRMACRHVHAEAQLLDVIRGAHRWVATELGLELRAPDGSSVLLTRAG